MTATRTEVDAPAPTATPPARPRRRRGSGLALLFLLPALAIFAVFIFYPLVRSVILSFQGVDIIGRPGAFVGTANYARLFSDPGFLKVLGVTAGFTVLTVVPSIVGGLAIALLLQQKIRAIRFFRTAFALRSPSRWPPPRWSSRSSTTRRPGSSTVCCPTSGSIPCAG